MKSDHTILFQIMPVLQQHPSLGHDFRFHSFYPNEPLPARMASLDKDKPEGFLFINDSSEEAVGYQRGDGKLITSPRWAPPVREQITPLIFNILNEKEPIIHEMFEYITYYKQEKIFFTLLDVISQAGVELYVRRLQTTLLDEATFCSDRINRSIMNDRSLLGMFSMLRRKFLHKQEQIDTFARLFINIGMETAVIGKINIMYGVN